MENRFPTGFSAEEIPHSEIDATMSNYKKTAGFDIQTLNQKKSFAGRVDFNSKTFPLFHPFGFDRPLPQEV